MGISSADFMLLVTSTFLYSLSHHCMILKMKYTMVLLFLALASLTSAFPKDKSDKRGLFHNTFGNNNYNPGLSVNRPIHGVVGGNYNGGLGNGIAGGLGGGFGVGLGGGLGGASSSSCRYWCRTPQGQAYCCEGANEPQSAVGIVKPGQCPPVRPVCPPTRSFGPPRTCSNDGACGGIDKCCFDTCLQEHVCKAPLGYGR